ncbi:hypothetical protein Bca101_012019 [Brassica carinata]
MLMGWTCSSLLLRIVSGHSHGSHSEAFQVQEHDSLHDLAKTSTQLPDVLGELISVKSTMSDSPKEKNVSWQLSNSISDPRVVAAASISPQIVGENIGLCACKRRTSYAEG